eukprot:TRINITY_DN1209_c0_g1_i1.p1 TRINITY_DN1209_c0_g1~~TRINITY_DN1209_c0_g1_i1.p1  ORF type:complete len:248 (+),score=42.88 TRINITY_DN1209_c0_g1_i1:196-939(+)
MPHSEQEHVANPNVFVAHIQSGIEVIHLYSGRQVCRLTLARNVLHTDMNGDGVIDHLSKGIETTYDLSKFSKFLAAKKPFPKRAIRMCVAPITTGIPQAEPLRNVSICPSSAGLFKAFGGGIDEFDKSIYFAQPVPIPSQEFPDEFDVAYLTSNGYVTLASSHTGRVKWQVEAEATTWDYPDNDSAGKFRRHNLYPSINAYSLKPETPANYILIVGEFNFEIMSRFDGTSRGGGTLFDIPISKVVEW